MVSYLRRFNRRAKERKGSKKAEMKDSGDTPEEDLDIEAEAHEEET